MYKLYEVKYDLGKPHKWYLHWKVTAQDVKEAQKKALELLKKEHQDKYELVPNPKDYLIIKEI